MYENDEYEVQKNSHLLMVSMITVFSVLLLAMNFLLGWEKWMLPIIICIIPASLIMHTIRRPAENLRTNIYIIILLGQMFYYTVHLEKIYDVVGMFVVMLVIFTTTNYRWLIWVAYLIETFAMFFHIFQYGEEVGLNLTYVPIVRSLWAFAIPLIAAIVTDRIVVMRRQLEKKYEDQVQETEDANRSAGDFLANVSHEIRTPINAVIGLSGVCIDREDDADIRMDLNSIRDAGRRVAEQVSDILDFSEIDRKRLAINKEDYMMSSVLNDLVLELRPYLRPELELVIDVDPELPMMMRTDVQKLKKILWHLVMNGLKYTKQGGVYVHITTKKQDYGVNLFIEVSDTGVGMDSDELEKVFDRFYQSDSGRTRSTSGLGLGMSIVSGFVQSLGGFITVESKPKRGTTVRVSIPQVVVDNSLCMSVINPKELHIAGFLHFDKFPHPVVREYYNMTVRSIVQGLGVTMHRVDNGDDLRKLVDEVELTHLFVADTEYLSEKEYIDQLAEKMIVEVVASDRFRQPYNSRINVMRKPFYCFPVASALNMYWHVADDDEGRLFCPGVRALVVDDEPMNLTVAMGVFRGYGMIVETAEGGAESIEMVSKKDYDIVFMDHMMPGMDGVEAMKRIRAEVDRRKLELPIVALTANAVSSAKEMFMREGFDGFVSKPIEIIELERVLKKVLPKSAIRFEKNEPNEENKKPSSYSGEVTEFAPQTKDQQSGENKSSGSDPADLDVLKEYGIDPAIGLKYCQQDVDFYKQLMKQFIGESVIKKVGMKESLEKNDLKAYAIYVHAIKSTAKMIGSMELSLRAERQEADAKAGNRDAIDETKETLMELYEKTIEGIKSVCGDTDEAEAKQSSDQEADGDVLEFSPSDGETGSSGADEILEFVPEGGDE